MSLSMNFCAAFLKRNPPCNFGLSQKCLLSSSSVTLNKLREGAFLNKLMGKSQKKRKPWTPEVGSSSPMGAVTKRTIGKQHSQRLVVLNNLFMEHITDFLSSSNLSSNLADFNLEISEVKIAVDLNYITVFWCSSNVDAHAAIQEQLESIAFPLRHELSQLSLLGTVPRIVFARDKRNDYLNEIDSLLRKADFGIDFIPTNPSLFHGIELPKSAEVPEIQDKTKEEKEAVEARLQEIQQKEVDELMALQKHSVFNLNQKVIMDKIKIAVQKSKAPHRKNIVYGEVIMESFPEDNLAAINERIKAIKSTDLKDFLLDRKKAIIRDQRLLEREMKKTADDKMTEEEIDERIKREFADDDSNFYYRDSSDDHRDAFDDLSNSNDYLNDSRDEHR